VRKILLHSNYEGTDLEELARDIDFHPVDQTHSVKLARQVDLSPGGDDGLVPHQKNIGTTSSPSESSSAAAVSQTR
jgi:hypothetical protein